jgi:hypothetical protein
MNIFSSLPFPAGNGKHSQKSYKNGDFTKAKKMRFKGLF